MSISPIHFNGMIQSTNEISNTKVQEDQKPVVQQANVSIEVEKKQEALSRQVNDPEDAQEHEYRYDREGNGSGYQGNQSKKHNQNKTEDSKDGSVKKKPVTSFDIRI